MRARLLGQLEEIIAEWGEKVRDEEGMPRGVYWPDDLVKNMACAAAAVFDANIDGQIFARDT